MIHSAEKTAEMAGQGYQHGGEEFQGPAKAGEVVLGVAAGSAVYPPDGKHQEGGGGEFLSAAGPPVPNARPASRWRLLAGPKVQRRPGYSRPPPPVPYGVSNSRRRPRRHRPGRARSESG